MARLFTHLSSAIASVGPVMLWPSRWIEACAQRSTPPTEATDRADPARLDQVLSLLGPFFEPELLCVVGAGTGGLCGAGFWPAGFQRIVVAEPDVARFGLLNAKLLLEPRADRISVHCARCGAPTSDATESSTQPPRSGAPRQRGRSAPGSARGLRQDTTVDRLVPWARPGAALVWISARALEQDTLAGARTVVGRGVPLLVGLPNAGSTGAEVCEALQSTLTGAPYTHCYRLGRKARAQALDRRELDLLLSHPGPQDGSTALLFF